MRIINFKFLKKKIHFLFRSPAIGWVCLLLGMFIILFVQLLLFFGR